MGDSETVIGEKGLASEFAVPTKAPTGMGGGAGKRDNILQAAQQSWDALNVSKVSNPFHALFGEGIYIYIAGTSLLPSCPRRDGYRGRNNGGNSNAL